MVHYLTKLIIDKTLGQGGHKVYDEMIIYQVVAVHLQPLHVVRGH